MIEHLPIFEPGLEVMHCVAFASGSGTNFREAVLESQERGSNFSIDYLITDIKRKKGKSEVIGALKYADQFGIKTATINGIEACGSWQVAKQTLEGTNEYHRRCLAFNQKIIDEVQDFERRSGRNFDLAVLAGYMRLFIGPLLRSFYNRAINIHPADLSVLCDDGVTRKYVGDNAVYDALSAGERRTRSSVILLDSEKDSGAILVSGPWVEYIGEFPVTQELADKHQDKQKQQSDWPALRFALRAISNGEIGLHRRRRHRDGNPVVVYKGEEMSYQGVEL